MQMTDDLNRTGETGMIDELDRKILDVIRDNARLSYQEIGQRVGISRVCAKNRMTAMQEKGVIRGYQTIIEPARTVGGIHFFLDIVTIPEAFEEVISMLASGKYVRKISIVSGDCAIHAEGYAAVPKNLEIFANSIYRSSGKGIRQIRLTTELSVLMDLDRDIPYVTEVTGEGSR